MRGDEVQESVQNNVLVAAPLPAKRRAKTQRDACHQRL